MRIFLALSPAKQLVGLMRKQDVKNVLVSFAFLKSLDSFKKLFCDDWYPKNLIIDSGAFSVWARGEKIDIDAYGDYCHSLKKFLPSEIDLKFVNLDVLPGKFGRMPTKEERLHSVEQGWKNMEYLEAKELSVIPVFHQHEDDAWLQRMMNHTDYFGISPANDESMKNKLRFLNDCFAITRDKYKTHGFAVTAYEQLINYPFFSVDSSSWCAGGRFGRIPIMVNSHLKNYMFKDRKELDKYWDYIDGIENKELIMTDYLARNSVGIKSYIKFEKFVTELWSQRGIKWE